MNLTKKSIEKFIADRWAYSEDEVIPVNARDLAEVLLVLQQTQRALLKANERLAIYDSISRPSFTIDLKELYG